jgi:hypothetical protein
MRVSGQGTEQIRISVLLAQIGLDPVEDFLIGRKFWPPSRADQQLVW